MQLAAGCKLHYIGSVVNMTDNKSYIKLHVHLDVNTYDLVLMQCFIYCTYKSESPQV